MQFPHGRRTILVPILGADITDDAFATARSLLGRSDTRLVLLHVVPAIEGELAPRCASDAPDTVRKWQRLAATTPDGTFVEVVRGDPAQVILDEAERFGSDLIVVGPTDSENVEGDWVERAIAQLVRAAPRRVHVARRRDRTPRSTHRAAAMRRRLFARRRFHAA